MTIKESQGMIFYDKGQHRKTAFRIIMVLLTVITLTLGLNLTISIANTPINKINFNQEYYDNNNQKKLALTFDDGPHEKNTLNILNILVQNNTKATFFFLGENILSNQDVVRKVDAAGMEIGNHSFTHSYNVHKSQKRIRWELNSTRRLLEEIIDKPVNLYRPPYLLDIGGEALQNINKSSKKIGWIEEAGYITVGADLDPKDWDAKSSEEVIDNLDKLINTGHIVLFHDGGRELRYTIGALDTIIKKYKALGYEFVTVSEILGLKKEEAKSPNTFLAAAISHVNILYVTILSFLSITLLSFIVKMIVILAFVRLTFVLLLFGISKFRKPKPKKTDVDTTQLTSSVVIPAFNEESGIASTIMSVLKNTQLPNEIIVVNDGSKDNTSRVVKKLQIKYPELIQLIELENGGKAKALNYAYHVSKSDIIIAMDGDSIFDKNAIKKLLVHFSDSQVVAVAGKVMPVTPKNYIGAFQSIEYLVGQNIEKASMSTINAVGVIPGPIGAWKRKVVNALGGYSIDTLVEDQDLTLAILASGGKIIYEPNAICYTETPDNLKDFSKQRFRWIYGTMQCFWKYKHYLLSFKRKNMGFVVMPNIALFNTIIPAFSPIIDVLALIAIFTGAFPQFLLAFNLFTIFDLLYASMAFVGKRDRRHIHLLMVLPLQRLFYRQILYYIVIKCLIKAMEGTSALWNKVERNGNIGRFYLKLHSR